MPLGMTNMSTILPHITASLNSLSIVLLLIGFCMIRSGKRDTHRLFMIAALATSALFLAFYLVYHFTQPVFVFPGPDSVKPLYYALLISHVIISLVVLPFIFVTVRRALGGRFEAHKGLARVTLAMWIFVAASGVAVYALLYHVYAPAV